MIKPDFYPKASEEIGSMIPIIERLIELGHAYASGGSVYFSVKSDPGYGAMTRMGYDEMLATANERGNNPDDPNKRDPLDFVLWQAGAPGEPTWESPWGPGRPGWHIECTAMATRYLGPSIDIHGGGHDLIFPHHECVIAQSENATGVQPFSRFWAHVAMVNYEGEKMSKSLGNLVLASTLLKTHPADAIRLYLFSHHYRATWEFQDEEMTEWAHRTARIHDAMHRESGSDDAEIDVATYREAFFDALERDLHTPAAIGTLIALADAVHAAPAGSDVAPAQDAMRELGGILGLTYEPVTA
jgi:L-cysteine:1D-myo-inositol 2-amino-2-deoxy-alpha-D-glucopyranoside ligase